MNTPFLQQVARHYLDRQGLEDYCFVFPNRRSGQFFINYLQQLLVDAEKRSKQLRPHLMPRVTSINDLVVELTGTATATDIEMVFALYDAYCQAMGDRAQEFDRFIYWAQLIIGDFNDIDRSLADAHEIYRNLEDLHDLSSNYLSREVREKVTEIFGENLFTAFFDTDADASLWRTFAKSSNDGSTRPDGQVKQEFLSLWNALGSIYVNYHKALADRGVLSPGYQLKMAAETPVDGLKYQRLVFVGFGVLSAAEVKLFDQFRTGDKADFWWDNAGIRSLLETAPHDPGALLIDGYCKRFNAKQLEPLNGDGCQVRVIAVPSTVGQAKQAFSEVREMLNNRPKTVSDIDTAIVLPDENLLVPLLHSVQHVDKLNVTLGYPLRSSGIVSLMHIVARMHHQATKEEGAWTYYREDVNDILSHPLIKNYFTDEALTMVSRLAVANRFRIPAAEFSELAFHDLFTPAMDSDQQRDEQSLQADYLDQLLSFCNLLMKRMIAADVPQPATKDESSQDSEDVSLQQAFLVMYIDVLNQLKQSLAQCRQTILPSTLFYLIDRLAASAIVPFTGEPLQGLQIMGLLETRSLDFRNVVILSMNERVFPRRRSINSFIPNYIRRAHGMSTIEQQEAIVAFNFYRLLNRAERVSLIYDSSSQKMGSSEPSRYISQLEKIYGKPIEHIEMNPLVLTSSPIEIEVPHDVAGDLQGMYTADPRQQGRYLSASAIKKYIACPLLFYMHYVQGLSDENSVSDFMDYATFGSIVHDSLMDCYDSEVVRNRGGLVDKPYLEQFRKSRLEGVVVENIKRIYLRLPEDQRARHQLRGEAYMLLDTIKSYVGFVIDYDMDKIDKEGPFTVIECEKTHDLPLFELGGVKFNFTYKADRIDRLADGTVRIVDYKTGKDKTSFSTMDDLFDRSKDDRCEAILQLFLYSYAYLTEHPDVKSVMPVIYKLSSMKESGVIYKSKEKDENGKKPAPAPYVFTMDNAVAKEFIARMAGEIKCLFEGNFFQAPKDADACRYCRMIDFCRRTPKRKYK